jgi:hypothetical protein
LLLEFTHQSFLNVAEVSVLQARQLLELRRPPWIYVALSSASTDDCTSNQILIRVDELVILKTEQQKEINVLFEEADTSFVLNRAAEMLVACIENPLGLEDFNDIEERWSPVHIECNFIENGCLLSYELIFLAGISQIIGGRLPAVQSA